MFVFSNFYPCPLFAYQTPELFFHSLPVHQEIPNILNSEGIHRNQPPLNFYELFREELSKRKPTFTKKVWNQDEDELLFHLTSQNLTWKEISHRIPKTNPEICKRRYMKLCEYEFKWTKEDDRKIKEMKQDQNSSWVDIADTLKNYTAKQIKERYENYLRDGIRTDEWSFEEDMKIIEFVKKNGKKWKRLSHLMPERTQIQVKNRYYGSLHPIQKQVNTRIQAQSYTYRNSF